MRHEHEELVAARADPDVGGAHRAAKRVRQAAEGEIPLLVAVGVVHPLQAVDVDRDDAVRLAMARRERVHQPDLLGEEVTIVEPGETVRRRLALRGLEHAPRGEAESHAVGGRAQDRDVEERFLVGLQKERADGIAAGHERQAGVVRTERHERAHHRVLRRFHLEEAPAPDRRAARGSVHHRMGRGLARRSDRLEDRDGRVGEQDGRRRQVEALLDAPGGGLRERWLIGREAE